MKNPCDNRFKVGDYVRIVNRTDLCWGDDDRYTFASRTDSFKVVYASNNTSRITCGKYRNQFTQVIRTVLSDYWSIGACDVELAKKPKTLRSWGVKMNAPKMYVGMKLFWCDGYTGTILNISHGIAQIEWFRPLDNKRCIASGYDQHFLDISLRDGRVVFDITKKHKIKQLKSWCIK